MFGTNASTVTPLLNPFGAIVGWSVDISVTLKTCCLQFVNGLFWPTSLSCHLPVLVNFQWNSWQHPESFHKPPMKYSNLILQICVYLYFLLPWRKNETLNDLPHFFTSGQQFSRLKGEEVGNWSGLISYPDDGGMKPARNGRKRYKTAQKPINNTTNTLERQWERKWERMPHSQWSTACMSGLETHQNPSANQTSRNNQLWQLKPIYDYQSESEDQEYLSHSLSPNQLAVKWNAAGVFSQWNTNLLFIAQCINVY